MNIAVSWLKKLVSGPKIIAWALKKVADGAVGAAPKAVYWWLVGKKTPAGLVFWSIWGLFTWMQSSGSCPAGWRCDNVSDYLFAVGTFLVGIGMLDAAARQDPPVETAKREAVGVRAEVVAAQADVVVAKKAEAVVEKKLDVLEKKG